MLEAVFAPSSVAVVGASPDPSRLGHRVLKNILTNGYGGRVFPIHPSAPASTVSTRTPLPPSSTCRPTARCWMSPSRSTWL